MQHRDPRARFGEAMRRFEPEEPAADDDDALTCGLSDGLDVVDVAKGEDSRQIHSRDVELGPAASRSQRRAWRKLSLVPLDSLSSRSTGSTALARMP
jgi:hypothetical protein